MRLKFGNTCVSIPKGVQILGLEKSYAVKLFKHESAKKTGTFMLIRKDSAWYCIEARPKKRQGRLLKLPHMSQIECFIALEAVPA